MNYFLKVYFLIFLFVNMIFKKMERDPLEILINIHYCRNYFFVL